ncbi:hypothetical protein O1Q96_02940 [Streptomyces sp. Qhu-G9]|uniref:hypothetical protein n=1 Tax=Streptomyces sp. Qhu-G9 TaxID=3452799 RepID=UPI0022ABFE01|nr:hypothetical protein [Streptomyces aurantiacus]WAU78805.1 hypothetical protein O1Q96_02940 [Streptomyces aurantiacus]
MGDPGGGRGTEAERVAELVGELFDTLAAKVRVAGPESVRVLTEEELQRHQLSWFRAGWEEHARASGQERPVGPDRPTARLLPFPERLREHPPDDEG